MFKTGNTARTIPPSNLHLTLYHRYAIRDISK